MTSSQIAELLAGLEAALELERELGVRAVECDRSLLTDAPKRVSIRAVEPTVCSLQFAVCSEGQEVPRPFRGEEKIAASATANCKLQTANSDSNAQTPQCPFAFLHHRPLSAAGAEMMEKITAAMGLTPATAPIVAPGEAKPSARICVVLGALALKAWYPGRAGAPGTWFRGDAGEEVLVTYSPEYFLRFTTVTPAVAKIKSDMWASLKLALRRIRG